MSAIVMFRPRYRVTINNPTARIVERCIENEPEPITGRRWRDDFYALTTPEAVFEHLAYNLGLHGLRLSQLEGWADCEDSDVAVEELDAGDCDVELEP